MKHNECIALFQEVFEQGIIWGYQQGIDWFRDRLLPAFDHLKEALTDQPVFLADAAFVIGDVMDLNGAPKKAIQYYEEAIRYDPDFVAAYRELAVMNNMIGQYEPAKKAIESAIRITDNKEQFIREFEEISINLKHHLKAIYQPENIVWIVRELLAEFNGKKAISLLRTKRKSVYLRLKAAAYSVQNDIKNYLTQWERIVDKSSGFDLTPQDWFFMPRVVFNQTTIWEILLKGADYVKGDIFFLDPDFLAPYQNKFSLKKRVELYFKYQLYRAQGNREKLDRMGRLFPECPVLGYENMDEMSDRVVFLRKN